MTTLLSTVESIPQGQLSNSAYSIVGVDVAKRKLDLYLLDKNESLKIPNQTEDITRVFNLLSKNSQRPLLVAMEATGGYELTLLNALVAAKIACTVLNPVRVRQFALGCGLLEKSDKIDAAIIAQHAHIRPPKLYVPREESALQLSEFCTHRERLLAALQQEKNRLESSFLPKLRTLITSQRTAVPSGIWGQQQHPAFPDFNLWPLVVLREPVVVGRHGRGVRLCGSVGCDPDGWSPRRRGGVIGSPLSRSAEHPKLL
ncbi:MAG: hypothetical protein RLZZ232_3669 [Planctomycetota bacterium]